MFQFKASNLILLTFLFTFSYRFLPVEAGYQDLAELSIQVGYLNCTNVPNIEKFLWNYHYIKNSRNFGEKYDEIEALLEQTKELYEALGGQINYYAKSQFESDLNNTNYYNLMIYWHIRSTQCQSLFSIFKWIEQDLLRLREDSTAHLRDVFDDSSFEFKMDNYIQQNYGDDLLSFKKISRSLSYSSSFSFSFS